MVLDDLVREHPIAATLLLALGAFSFASFALKTLTVFVETLLLPGIDLSKYGARDGGWAVVTGASDGIGREFAVQLARAGFNVVLSARTVEKLNDVAKVIEKESGGKVQTEVVPLDFASPDRSGYGSLLKHNVRVLINNVGRSQSIPVDFAEIEEKEMDDIVSVNVGATVHVTRLILPGMVQRKNGLILNVGSFSGAVPSPMLATYSGSKAFISTWTDALAAEAAPHGVLVQHLNTYFVATAMSKIRRSTWLVPTPSLYVRSALSRIGRAAGAAHTGRPASLTPYPPHALFDWALSLIPVAWRGVQVTVTHQMHVDIRRRALKKRAREAAAGKRE